MEWCPSVAAVLLLLSSTLRTGTLESCEAHCPGINCGLFVLTEFSLFVLGLRHYHETQEPPAVQPGTTNTATAYSGPFYGDYPETGSKPFENMRHFRQFDNRGPAIRMA